MPDLTFGDADTQSDELNASGLIGPQGSRGQAAALNDQKLSYYRQHNKTVFIMVITDKANFRVA